MNTHPLISVIIAAFNEEGNISKCLTTLNNQSMPRDTYEIIVIDNNSTDKTAEIAMSMGAEVANCPIQGVGPSRQMGLELAAGRYILCADADCLYSRDWIKNLSSPLIDDITVVVTYSAHTFIPEKGYSNTKLWIYSSLRRIMAKYKSISRPYLNVYGMSMGFRRLQGLGVGYPTTKQRGEDGRIAFDLMKYGKIKEVYAPFNTSVRSLKQEGSLLKNVLHKVRNEIPYLMTNLFKKKPHDTKASINPSRAASTNDVRQ